MQNNDCVSFFSWIKKHGSLDANNYSNLFMQSIQMWIPHKSFHGHPIKMPFWCSFLSNRFHAMCALEYAGYFKDKPLYCHNEHLAKYEQMAFQKFIWLGTWIPNKCPRAIHKIMYTTFSFFLIYHWQNIERIEICFTSSAISPIFMQHCYGISRSSISCTFARFCL